MLDDVVELRTGQQVVADGEVIDADNLEIDESLLTGEADSIAKNPGDEVLSGSAVVAGGGHVRVTKVGADNYAAKLAEEAKRFTLVNSPLRNDVNRIVTWVGYAIIPIGLLLASSQFWRLDQGWQDAIISTVAGLIGMVPEGLVLLTSVAFAVGVVRLSKRRCLVQELPAIEVLARVDVLCADKTGTITEGRLALAAIEPEDGADPAEVASALAAMAEQDPDPNATLNAVKEHFARRTPARRSRTLVVAPDRTGAVLLGAQVERDVLRRPRRLGARRAGVRAARRLRRRAQGARRAARRRGQPGAAPGPLRRRLRRPGRRRSCPPSSRGRW